MALELLKNANVAAGMKLPSCQDTGTGVAIGKRGQFVWTDGNDEEALSKGIFDTYRNTNLRYSQVRHRPPRLASPRLLPPHAVPVQFVAALVGPRQPRDPGIAFASRTRRWRRWTCSRRPTPRPTSPRRLTSTPRTGPQFCCFCRASLAACSLRKPSGQDFAPQTLERVFVLTGPGAKQTLETACCLAQATDGDAYKFLFMAKVRAYPRTASSLLLV